MFPENNSASWGLTQWGTDNMHVYAPEHSVIIGSCNGLPSAHRKTETIT